MIICPQSVSVLHISNCTLKCILNNLFLVPVGAQNKYNARLDGDDGISEIKFTRFQNFETAVTVTCCHKVQFFFDFINKLPK